MPRPELEPLRNAATAAIRRSLEARMEPAMEAPPEAQADELSDEDRAALVANYQTLK